MSTIKVWIQGVSPLLVNRFTEQAAAKVSAGTGTAINIHSKGTPREQAEPKLYTSADGSPIIPGPNVFRGIVDAGVYQKAGRKAITTGRASLVAAGIVLTTVECFLERPDGKPVTWEVDSRSVVIPASGGRIMCHRPRFDSWRLGFELHVDDSMFDEGIVRRLVDDMGSKVGLGDFRPARKGPFGRFDVVHWQRTVVSDRSHNVGGNGRFAQESSPISS